MEPRPIKVTNLADGIISSNKKAIENAKTGKVTAIAAVMYLNKINRLNLHDANSKKIERLIVVMIFLGGYIFPFCGKSHCALNCGTLSVVTTGDRKKTTLELHIVT
jgi:hypothetical protein